MNLLLKVDAFFLETNLLKVKHSNTLQMERNQHNRVQGAGAIIPRMENVQIHVLRNKWMQGRILEGPYEILTKGEIWRPRTKWILRVNCLIIG